MTRILIAGAGGQGIVSLGKMISYAAVEKGLNVTCIPSYGPEMRGGAASCSVVLCLDEITSPVISRADVLVALNRQSLDKYEGRIGSEGRIIVDGTLIDECDGKDPRMLALPVWETAELAGDRKSANMVVMGVLAGMIKELSLRSVVHSVAKVFSEKTKLIQTSLRAVRAGFLLVQHA